MEKEHFEMLLEDINDKSDLIIEGHDGLRGEIRELSRKTDERFDLVDFKIDTLDKKTDGVEDKLTAKIDGVEANLLKKIDAVAADLSAHRLDTEVHRGY